MKQITLVGATGLVGREITKQAGEQKLSVKVYNRNQKESLLEDQHDHLIFCAGENKCSAESLSNIVDVNSLLIAQLIQKQNFAHLTYFSSTRIYSNSKDTTEDAVIPFDLRDPRSIFSASKLVAEAACTFSKKPVLILRPSNIYGATTTSNLFLPSITRDAIQNKLINMHVRKDYAKDYINVKDVAFFALEMSKNSLVGTFNIASGVNIPAKDIATILEEETACTTIWHTNTSSEVFHSIDVRKLNHIFPNHKKSSLDDDLRKLTADFKKLL